MTTAQRLCVDCDVPLVRQSTKGRWRTRCEACRVDAHKRYMVGWNASHAGCNRNRGPRLTITTTCGTCGIEVVKHKTSRYLARYCSLACRDVATRVETARQRILPAVYVAPKINWPQRLAPRLPAVLYSGQCRHCRSWFVSTGAGGIPAFCSKVCNRRWWRKDRKTRTGERVSDAVRAEVYARDGGVCQLCLDPVDMTLPAGLLWSPTVDHVFCISWSVAAGQSPDHSASNLRLAHLVCNSTRSDERHLQEARPLRC